MDRRQTGKKPGPPIPARMDIVTKKFQLHQTQYDFHHSAARYRGFVGGRGSGKSYVGAYDLLRRAMSDEGKGRLYMVVSPTYIILQDATIRSLAQLAEDFGIIRDQWKQPPRLVLTNGSEIIFRSGDDPEKLRGPNLSGIWLDEASIMDEEVFNISIATLREGGRAGWLTATFTPKGMSHWTYDVFGRETRENTALFKSSTADNPFLPPDFISALSGQYSDRQSSQEIDGEFVDQEGAEWPNSHFGDHIWTDSFPDSDQITIRIIGIDPSKGKDARFGDYSAIVKLARDKNGILYCEAYMERIDAERMISRVIKENQEFCPDGVVVESNQFQHLLASQILEESKKTGNAVPILTLYNTVSKDVRIRRLGPYLANRLIRFKRNDATKILVSQLREFPRGKHDDGPDALEMALRSMISMWNGRRNQTGNKAKRLTS